MVRHPVVGASSILVGTAIGAGVFGIPFVIARAGFWIGISYLLILGVVTLLTLLAYAEIVLRTQGVHQFPGYAQLYLGKYGKWLAVSSLLFGMYGAMTAYLTEIGNFLASLLEPYIGGNNFLYALLFWFIIVFVAYKGINIIARLETLIIVAMFVVLIALYILGISEINLQNFTPSNITYLFLPYGVVLFAYGSVSSIPEMKRLLHGKKQLSTFPKAVIAGVAGVAVFYILFTIIIIGVTGNLTTESAIIGLGDVLGPIILLAGALLGILTMGGSFIVIALALKQMYHYDFKLKIHTALALTLLPPLIIYILHLASFIQILGIVGAITVGFQGIIIWTIYQQAKQTGKRKPEFSFKIPRPIILTLQSLFVLGIIYEIWYIISPVLQL